MGGDFLSTLGGSGGDTTKEFGRSSAASTFGGDIWTEGPKIQVPDNTLLIAIVAGLGALVLVIALVFLKKH